MSEVNSSPENRKGRPEIPKLALNTTIPLPNNGLIPLGPSYQNVASNSMSTSTTPSSSTASTRISSPFPPKVPMPGPRSPRALRRDNRAMSDQSEGGSGGGGGLCSSTDENEQTDSESTSSTIVLVQERQAKIERPTELVTSLYEYRAQHDDELNLNRGSRIEVLSKDGTISGGEGWWTGRVGKEVGVFPSNFVGPPSTRPRLLDEPPTIPYEQLSLEQQIGVGGFAKVHRAILRTTGEVVAVKAITVSADQQPEELEEAVRQEGKIFHCARHRNIVELKGVCLEQPNLCLVLEYCAGGSLNKLTTDGNCVGPEILVDWAVQIARGMHYLHEEAVVSLLHRDLKSANVLIKEFICSCGGGAGDGVCVACGGTCMGSLTLKIADFGLAREAYGSTRFSNCGTYAWMAPEVIKSSAFTKHSDVWSYGVLLWELLTGETPYRGIDHLAVAYGVAVQQLTLPIPSSCPEELSKIMQDCWNIDAQKRPTFRGLIEELEGLRQGGLLSSLDDMDFRTLQEAWKKEIQEMFDELKQKETELRTREEELRTLEVEHTKKMAELMKLEAKLGRWSEELEKRQEELAVLEAVKRLELEGRPEPTKREGKLNRNVYEI